VKKPFSLGARDPRIFANRCLVASPNGPDDKGSLIVFNGRYLGENPNHLNFKPHVIDVSVKADACYIFENIEYSLITTYITDRHGCNGFAEMN